MDEKEKARRWLDAVLDEVFNDRGILRWWNNTHWGEISEVRKIKLVIGSLRRAKWLNGKKWDGKGRL